MESENNFVAQVDAMGESLIEKAGAMLKAAEMWVREKFDDFMNGLISKISGLCGAAVDGVKSGAGRMADSVKATVTPSASPKLSKNVSPEKGHAVGKEVSGVNSRSSPDMSNLLKDSGCGDLVKFQCESMTGQESIHSGCMSAAMARQVGVKAAAEQEVGMQGPGGSR